VMMRFEIIGSFNFSTLSNPADITHRVEERFFIINSILLDLRRPFFDNGF